MNTPDVKGPAKKRRSRGKKHPQPLPARALGTGVPPETARRAAGILEVLAGVRTPGDVAAALGMSLPYFYLLERKALAGLVEACAPQARGPAPPSLEEQLAATERKLAQSERECQRLAALVRTMQRAVGLSAAPAEKPSVKDGAKKSRRRRPVIRALRAAQTLRKNSAGENSPAELERMSAVPDGSSTARSAAAAASGPVRSSPEPATDKEREHGG